MIKTLLLLLFVALFSGSLYAPVQPPQMRGAAKIRGRVTIAPLDVGQTIYESIISEAAMANSESNHPLPLFSSWSIGNPPTDGGDADGFNPDFVMLSIAAGHHILPYATAPLIDQGIDESGYWNDAMEFAALHSLPLSFVMGNMEGRLTSAAEYTGRTCATSPLACNSAGTAIDTTTYGSYTLSPFGYNAQNTTPGSGTWYAEGYAYGSSPQMGELQYLYPTPPSVHFIDNHESVMANWYTTRLTDWHYTHNDDGSARYSTGDSDLLSRERVNAGWQARYNAMQQGFRDGLEASAAAHSPAVTNSTWADVVKFGAYQSLTPQSIARTDFWYYGTENRHVNGHITDCSLIWDLCEMGGPGYYYDANVYTADYRALSPNVEVMNLPFMIEDALSQNADWWFELPVWSGGSVFADAIVGGGWTGARFNANVRWAMWMTRPRVVRFYAASNVARSEETEWHDPVLESVDEIYDNATLTTFWRGGALVANTTRSHPYNHATLPAEYSSTDRMFMLTTSSDPATPWSVTTAATSTVLPVFAMARVIGTTPNRQWLVYVYSPQAPLSDVVITIPDYDDITVDTTVAGQFWLVSESDTSVTLIM